MVKETNHYVKFYYQGLIVGEQSIEKLDGAKLPIEVDVPDNAYAFQLLKRTDVIDGEHTFKGAYEEESKLIYPEGKITTLEEVKQMPAEQVGPALVSNMEGNNWDAVIWTRWMTWPQPYDPDRMEILHE